MIGSDLGDLGALLSWRIAVVDRTLHESEPRTEARFGTATARREFENPMLTEPILASFSQIGQLGAAQRQHRLNRPHVPAAPSWEPLTGIDQLTRPGLAPVTSQPHIESLPTATNDYMARMSELQANRRARLMAERQERQRQAGEELARNNGTAGPTTDEVCPICQEGYEDGEVLVHLVRGHKFHLACNDGWIAAQMDSDVNDLTPLKCCVCRSDLEIASTAAWMPNHTPPSASASYTSAHSEGSLTLPWWPADYAESGIYHTSTQLPDGRLSLIVDPGAWTNLMGANLSRKFATQAVATGHRKSH